MNGKHSRGKGLTVRFGALLCLAGLISGGLFLTLQMGGVWMIQQYLENEEIQQQRVEEQIALLQEYVTEHNLSTDDARQLTRGANRN